MLPLRGAADVDSLRRRLPRVDGGRTGYDPPVATDERSRGGAASQAIADRNRKMQVAKIRGATHDEIAEEFHVSVATSREVWSAMRDMDFSLDEDPVEVVVDHLMGFKDLRKLAYEVFDEAAGTTISTESGTKVTVGANSAARVGALRLAMELRVREIALRQDTGLLPKNLGQLQVQLDVRRIFEDFGKLLQKHKVAPELVEDLRQIVRTTTAKQIEAAPAES